MKRALIVVVGGLLLLAGLNRYNVKQSSAQTSSQVGAKPSLAEARHGFRTKLVRQEAQNQPAPSPPGQLFRSVRYDSPAGKLAAYVSQPAKDGRRHPAIVWVIGGFDNDIGDTPWQESSPENDQSASAFWKAGIVTMYPSFRGGNDNPGYQEGLFGEVDDVLAAADYLAKQDFVDPSRIYLGGHSTGGTLVLLAAESSGRFRAIFAFGPVDDVAVYGAENLVFDTSNRQELALRSPKLWMHSIHNPTFVFEGTESPGNISHLRSLRRASSNPMVQFFPVPGFNHFSILAPMTRLLSAKVLSDSGPAANITFTKEELASLKAR